jgi:hypothetical protein
MGTPLQGKCIYLPNSKPIPDVASPERASISADSRLISSAKAGNPAVEEG